jgi:hypothetical protein
MLRAGSGNLSTGTAESIVLQEFKALDNIIKQSPAKNNVMFVIFVLAI